MESFFDIFRGVCKADRPDAFKVQDLKIKMNLMTKVQFSSQDFLQLNGVIFEVIQKSEKLTVAKSILITLYLSSLINTMIPQISLYWPLLAYSQFVFDGELIRDLIQDSITGTKTSWLSSILLVYHLDEFTENNMLLIRSQLRKKIDKVKAMFNNSIDLITTMNVFDLVQLVGIEETIFELSKGERISKGSLLENMWRRNSSFRNIFQLRFLKSQEVSEFNSSFDNGDSIFLKINGNAMIIWIHNSSNNRDNTLLFNLSNILEYTIGGNLFYLHFKKILESQFNSISSTDDFNLSFEISNPDLLQHLKDRLSFGSSLKLKRKVMDKVIMKSRNEVETKQVVKEPSVTPDNLETPPNTEEVAKIIKPTRDLKRIPSTQNPFLEMSPKRALVPRTPSPHFPILKPSSISKLSESMAQDITSNSEIFDEINSSQASLNTSKSPLAQSTTLEVLSQMNEKQQTVLQTKMANMNACFAKKMKAFEKEVLEKQKELNKSLDEKLNEIIAIHNKNSMSLNNYVQVKQKEMFPFSLE